jgi:HEAT repeat protein
MRVLFLGVVASGSLLLHLTMLGCAASATDSPQHPGSSPSPSSASLSITVTDGKLNLKSGGASLSQVLEAIAAHSGIPIHIHDRAQERITLSFTDLALDEGLQRILRGKNFILFYAASSAVNGSQSVAPKLRAVHVFANGAPRVLLDAQAAPETDQIFDHASLWSEKSAADGLVQVLLEGKSKRSRKRAAKALGDVWSAEAVAPLSAAVLEDNEPIVRETAAAALGQTWSEEAVEPLRLSLVEDQDPTVRAAAALALGETWSEAAVEPLTRAFLEDPDPIVRERAARALREIGSKEALNSLTGQ